MFKFEEYASYEILEQALGPIGSNDADIPPSDGNKVLVPKTYVNETGETLADVNNVGPIALELGGNSGEYGWIIDTTEDLL